VAGNDSSQHPDGEEPQLTDEQRSAIDRISELLADFPPSRRRAFKRYLRGLTHGEKGRKEGDNENHEGGSEPTPGQWRNAASKKSIDENNHHQGD